MSIILLIICISALAILVLGGVMHSAAKADRSIESFDDETL